MSKNRNRFLSDQSPLHLYEKCKNETSPPSPIIPTLALETGELLEDIEIPPSEDYEAQKEELSAYLSTKDDDQKENKKPPKLYHQTQFDITLSLEGKSKRRAYSGVVGHTKLLIYDALTYKGEQNSLWQL